MGASSKRRGGDPSVSRSKPHRKDKSSRDREREKSKHDRASSNTSSNYDNDKHNGSSSLHNNSNSNMNGHRRPHRVFDTTLLARGMTSRYIGIRVANHVKILPSAEIERDIRHMEAHSAASISYAQQLFAFSNRELVSRGLYGPAPPAPGMKFVNVNAGGGSGGKNGYGNGQPSVTMPIKIDPEEEKRLAILRKRVAASEAKREVLETEYLSLRAHYVHESHKLRRTRSSVTGQLKLLRDLLNRRGESLALRRVKCAVAREALAVLEYRDEAGSSLSSTSTTPSTLPSGKTDFAASATTPGEGQDKDGDALMTENESAPTPEPPAPDLTEVWSTIESGLYDADVSCGTIDTPEEMRYMKAALKADADALEMANDPSSVERNAAKRSRSPARIKDDDEEDNNDKNSSNKSGDKDKEKEKDASGSGSGTGSGGKKKKSRSERAARRGTSDSTSLSHTDKDAVDQDDNIISWKCRMMPRTPYGVALYLTNLSKSPELAGAFSCGDLFGGPNESLAWLQTNLPSRTRGAQKDSEELENLKKEIGELSAELKKEVELNSDLQHKSIEGRKESDQICAMMTMIRSETEAVIYRHNQILEANEVMESMQQEESEDADVDMNVNASPDGDGEVEEGEVEEDGDGTVVAEDDDGQDGFGTGADGGLNKFGGTYDASDEGESVGITVREVLVPSQNGGSAGKSASASVNANASASTSHNKRGYADTQDLMDSDKKRRKV